MSVTEENALIAEVFTVPPSRRREIRDDKPELAAQYNDLWRRADELERQRAQITSELRGLEVELLTDDDRTRMAAAARAYLGTGEFEDEDPLPVTPCPEWCDSPAHAEKRSGSWHDGATCDIVITDGVMSCSVTLGTDGEATDGLYLNIDASASSVTADQAERFAAGLLRAANLYRRLSRSDSAADAPDLTDVPTDDIIDEVRQRLSGHVIPEIENLHDSQDDA